MPSPVGDPGDGEVSKPQPWPLTGSTGKKVTERSDFGLLSLGAQRGLSLGGNL